MTIMMVAPAPSVHTRRFAEALLSKGHRVVGVCETNPFPEGREGFSYALLPHPRPGSSLVHGLLDRLLGYTTVERMIMRAAGLWLRALWYWYRPTVVHRLSLDRKANVCLSAGLRPLVLNPWGTDVNRHFLPDADPFERELCCEALRGADLVICDAPEMVERCAEVAGVPVESALLHLGVDTELFFPMGPGAGRPWRERLEIPQDAKVFFSARAWHPRYSHHLVLEAFSEASGRISGNTFLVFKTYNVEQYPEARDYEAQLKHRAEELGISERVRWLKAVEHEQLPELYAMADVVVNFPQMDTLGITLMEAALCERPLISCGLLGYRGTFVERYARLVPPGDTEGLAEAMVDVIELSPPKRSFLEEARRAVESEYSYEGFIEKLEAINEGLARGGRPRFVEAREAPVTERSRGEDQKPRTPRTCYDWRGDSIGIKKGPSGRKS
jgi:glycosyltransferase involved in cell wall biosynthesis